MTLTIIILSIVIMLAFVLFILLGAVISKQTARIERQSEIIESLNIVIKSYENQPDQSANS